MPVIFAVPRFLYASYADLYELIRLSEFPTCFIDEIDQSSDNHYIVTIYNGEFGDYSGSRAKIHLLDLEYHMGDNALPPLPNVEVWAADKWYAEQIGAKYMPMGSHKGLRETVTDRTKQYDVAYIGFIDGLHRREAIRQALIERGVTVSPKVAWGTMRDWLLNDSRAYLHVHQHAHIPAVPPLRLVVAAAYSLPIITETCANAAGFTHLMFHFDYGDLVRGVIDTLSSPELANAGNQLHYILCERDTFRKSVENAL